MNRESNLKEFRRSLKEAECKFCNLAYSYQLEDKLIDEIIKYIKNIRKKVEKILKDCL
jgi:hypothetical protein